MRVFFSYTQYFGGWDLTSCERKLKATHDMLEKIKFIKGWSVLQFINKEGHSSTVRYQRNIKEIKEKRWTAGPKFTKSFHTP